MLKYEEQLHIGINSKGYSQSFEIDKIIYSQKTDFQDLIIFENFFFGRVLALDGVIQVTEFDEYIYHEMMAHLPMVAHGEPESVLIIGGGDGGVLREALKHPDCVVTLVELDACVIDTVRKYMPKICGDAFNNKNAVVKIEDGYKYVLNTDEKYDVIIVDSTDPIGPGKILFSSEFYKNCRRILNYNGILITQNGVPSLQPQEISDTHRRFSKVGFKDSWFSVISVPTYIGGFMALGWGSDNLNLRLNSLEILKKRWNNLDIDTLYYNPEIHKASFALPNYIRKLF